MHRIIFTLIAVLFLTGCATRATYVPDEWAKCDGIPKPVSVGETLGNIALLSSTFGMLGKIPPAQARDYYRQRGDGGVLACSQVLSGSPFNDGKEWERHTNILKARAIHYLEVKDAEAALADLAKIDGVAGENTDNVFYKRSLGLSVKFLQGLAYQLKDDFTAADEKFHQFSTMRPYSKNVQTLAWQNISMRRAAVTERLVKLDAQFLYLHASLLEWEEGKEEAAADQWAILVAGGYKKAATIQFYDVNVGKSDNQGNNISDPDTIGRAALAAARVKRMPQAHELISQAKTALPEQPGDGTGKDDIIKRLRRNAPGNMASKIAFYQIVIDAYDRYYAGDIPTARQMLYAATGELTILPPVIDLIEKLKVDMPPEKQTGLFKLDMLSMRDKIKSRLSPLKRRKEGFLDSLFTRLPLLEQKSEINSYSGKVWFFKNSGFSEEKNKDGTYLIKFTGETSTPTVVEEMSMLRAADLAKEASKEGFIVLEFKNYIRTLRTTYNGVPMGEGTPAGFNTTLKVVFVDPDNIPEKWAIHKGRIFNAGEVWKELSPIYIRTKKRKGTT